MEALKIQFVYWNELEYYLWGMDLYRGFQCWMGLNMLPHRIIKSWHWNRDDVNMLEQVLEEKIGFYEGECKKDQMIYVSHAILGPILWLVENKYLKLK